MKRLCFISTILLSTLLFSGCENDEDANLYKAQDCVNTATAASANNCLVYLASDTSKRANIIRCSVAFISEGIDDSAIVNAFENIEGEEAGDPTAPAFAALSMSSTTASSNALTTCSETGSDALTALANLANLATATSTVLGLTPPITGAQIEAAIDSFTPGGSTPDKEALGNAVLASQASMCNSDNGMFKDTDACADINQAVTANPNGGSALAEALIANLDNQNN